MPGGRGWILRLVLMLGGLWLVLAAPTRPFNVALAKQAEPPVRPIGPVPDSSVFQTDSEAVAETAASPEPVSAAPPAEPAPAASPAPFASGVCAGDERISYVPEQPRVGAELIVAVTSARQHPFPNLAGTERTTPSVQRTGQLGYVWEWTIQPTYPGQHEYTFYVDSTIPCQRISLDVSGALATATLRPTRTPKPYVAASSNGNENNNDNQGQPTSMPTPTPIPGVTPTSTPTVVPTVPAIDRISGSYLGVWTSDSASQTADVDRLGVGWARAVAIWASIESTDNTYNWTSLDAQVNAASGGGKRRVLVMVRNNPAWAAASRCKVTTDAERTRLADFVTVMVNRYKDRVKYWQLYNEMDNTSESFDQQYDLGGCFGTANGTTPTQTGRDNYARMLETVGAAVHAADPQAKVVTGALVSGNLLGPTCPTCLFDADFGKGVLSSLRAAGTLDRLDYLAVHFFSSQHDAYLSYGPDLVGRVSKLRQEMREAGLSESQVKPIMVDEGSFTGMIGTSTSNPNDAFNRAQRDYVVKALARAAAADVVYFWFWLRDVSGGGLGGDNAYGLQAVDGTSKPSYNAFRYFTSLVDTQERLVGRISASSSNLEGYDFTAVDGRRFQVVWNVTAGPEEAYAPGGTITQVTDTVGTRLADSVSSVAVGAEPRFIFYRP